MLGRTFIAAASFVVIRSGFAFAQTPRQTRRARKLWLSKRSSGMRPDWKRRAHRTRSMPTSATTVPLTLEDAVRRAVDNNLEIAVERLNPQTFDFTLASLRANYNPNATSNLGRRDNVRPPTNLLNPGSPERLDDDLQRGVSHRTCAGAVATTR